MHASKFLAPWLLTVVVASAGCGGSSEDGLKNSDGGTSGTGGSSGTAGSSGASGSGGSSGSSGAGGAGGDISLSEVPPLYAQALCEAQRGCFGDLLAVILSGEDCETNAETAIRDTLPRLEQAIAAGKIRYDGTKIQACLDQVRTLDCVNGPEPTECTAAIDGTVAVGGECSMSDECAGGDTYCKVTAACPGHCAPREVAGGPCSRDNECVRDLSCSDTTGRCFAPATADQPCGAGQPECQGGLFCVGADEDAGRPGTCRTLADAFSVSAGGSCLIGAPFCQPNLRCTIDSVSGGVPSTRCAAPVASGAACKLAYPDVCPGDQYCKIATGTIDGVCTAKPGNGQPCAVRNAGEDPICAPNTRCDAGTCRSRQKLGGTCQTGAVCYSENCISGGCAPGGACE
jgi:hypothetical protein